MRILILALFLSGCASTTTTKILVGGLAVGLTAGLLLDHHNHAAPGPGPTGCDLVCQSHHVITFP